MNDPAEQVQDPEAPPQIELAPALKAELDMADALPEIVVLYAPTPEVLEAYAFEESLGVIAVVPGGYEDRVKALEVGALEVLDPALPEAEARARLETAVARFRSRLHLETIRDDLDRQALQTERNLRLAARLQRSFLPRALPEREEVSFSTAYLPQEFVSGDSYEIRQLDARHVAIYTLDAVGHGVRAGLITVLLRSMFQPLAGETVRPPHEVVAELNNRLRDAKLEESPTAAFCYAVLDLERGTMRLANAGHPLPVRLKDDGTTEQLGSSGMLLGIDPETYETSEVHLEPRQRVFFFTDGADPGYGDGFAQALALHRDLDLEDQVGGALGSVIELDDEGRPHDDVTVVAMEYRGRDQQVT